MATFGNSFFNLKFFFYRWKILILREVEYLALRNEFFWVWVYMNRYVEKHSCRNTTTYNINLCAAVNSYRSFIYFAYKKYIPISSCSPPPHQPMCSEHARTIISLPTPSSPVLLAMRLFLSKSVAISFPFVQNFTGCIYGNTIYAKKCILHYTKWLE